MAIKLIVSGLSEDINEENLFDLFEVYGPIVDVELVCDESSGDSLGFGYLVFETEAGAARARMSADGQVVGGETIRVRAEHAGQVIMVDSVQAKAAGGAQLES